MHALRQRGLKRVRRFHKDLWGGGLMMVLGVAVAIHATSFEVGTLSRMGPGYFPLALGVILTIAGAAIAAGGYRAQVEDAGAPTLRPQWKAWALICASIVAFVVFAEYAGLVPATFGIVFISALADRENTWKEATVLALALVIVCVVVFWWGLQVQLPLFRTH